MDRTSEQYKNDILQIIDNLKKENRVSEKQALTLSGYIMAQGEFELLNQKDVDILLTEITKVFSVKRETLAEYFI